MAKSVIERISKYVKSQGIRQQLTDKRAWHQIISLPIKSLYPSDDFRPPSLPLGLFFFELFLCRQRWDRMAIFVPFLELLRLACDGVIPERMQASFDTHSVFLILLLLTSGRNGDFPRSIVA